MQVDGRPAAAAVVPERSISSHVRRIRGRKIVWPPCARARERPRDSRRTGKAEKLIPLSRPRPHTETLIISPAHLRIAPSPFPRATPPRARSRSDKSSMRLRLIRRLGRRAPSPARNSAPAFLRPIVERCNSRSVIDRSLAVCTCARRN